jgi:hypothetical protein
LMAWDGATESGQQAQAEDAAAGLPLEVAAHLVLPGGERAFVTMPTLSPHGAQAHVQAGCASTPPAWGC